MTLSYADGFLLVPDLAQQIAGVMVLVSRRLGDPGLPQSGPKCSSSDLAGELFTCAHVNY